MAIKDDLFMDIDGNGKAHHSPEKYPEQSHDQDKLTLLVLSLFNEHGIYNWEAVKNLILSDAEYFNFTLQDAETLYRKFIVRNIIAYTGNGKASCLTEEGTIPKVVIYGNHDFIANRQTRN